MKFLITKELKDNSLLRLLVTLLLSFFMLFLALDILIHHYQIGLNLDKAIETIIGDEDNFIEPILFDVLIERVHIDIFISMILLTLLVIIYIRVEQKPKNIFIHIVFLSNIFSSISFILAYFYGEIFIILWIGLFLLWHIIAFYISFFVIRELIR